LFPGRTVAFIHRQPVVVSSAHRRLHASKTEIVEDHIGRRHDDVAPTEWMTHERSADGGGGMISVEETILLLFTILNALQIISYIPQIVCVIRDAHGATAISYSTWLIWAAGTGVTTAYAMVNIWDPWLAVVNAVHTLCCIAVVVLTFVKRMRIGRALASARAEAGSRPTILRDGNRVEPRRHGRSATW
jgi:hypothetical protein